MEVVKDLTCPICLEFYSHPIILPCSHVMCRQPCAENLFEGNFIRCPVCRDNCYVSGGMSSLPRVITIESIIEKIRAERKKRMAASHAHRRDNGHDDVGAEGSPDSWKHKGSSLEDLFSDIGSERMSPDISPFRTTPSSNPSAHNGSVNSNDQPSGRSTPKSSSPSFVHNTSVSNTVSAPTAVHPSVPLARRFTSASGFHSNATSSAFSCHSNPIPSTATGCRSINSPRQTTFSEGHGRYFNILSSSSYSSSHLSPISNSVSPFEAISTPRPQGISEQSMHIDVIQSSNHGIESNASVFQPPLRTADQIIRHISAQYDSIHSNNNNNNNDIIHNTTNNSSSNGSNLQRRVNSLENSRLRPENADLGFRNTSPPLVNSNQGVQNVDSIALRSARYNSLRICHERSIANLQACSNSILDLQNEYLTLSHQIHNQVPHENQEAAKGASVDALFTPISRPVQTVTSSSSVSTPNLEPIVVNCRASTFRSNYGGAVDGDGNTRTSATVTVAPSEPPPLSLPSSSSSPSSDEAEQVGMSRGTVHLSRPGDKPEGVDVASSKSTVAGDLKQLLKRQLEKLCNAQCQLVEHMSSYRCYAQREQGFLEREKKEINKECDSLVAEIENKRVLFLLHLEDEIKHGGLNLSDVTVATETLLESTQHLIQFVGHAVESKPDVLLNASSHVFDGLSRAVEECESCLQKSMETFTDMDDSLMQLVEPTPPSGFDTRDLDFMDAPSRPVIDTRRCVRNTNTVALALAPPPSCDVIDYYEVCYCSEAQMNLGIEERYYAMQGVDMDAGDDSFPVVLIDNLGVSTHYFFCVCAVNRRGRSVFSDYVQCLTLGEQECVVPVPTVMDNLSHASATSIKMVCPSLATVTSHQEVGHLLLRRCEQGACLWKGRELCSNGAEEHFLVTKLRPKTRYYFIVMACNSRGECQLSPVSVVDTL